MGQFRRGILLRHSLMHVCMFPSETLTQLGDAHLYFPLTYLGDAHFYFPFFFRVHIQSVYTHGRSCVCVCVCVCAYTHSLWMCHNECSHTLAVRVNLVTSNLREISKTVLCTDNFSYVYYMSQ